MHAIEHFLGLCGEAHPNVWTIILLVLLVKFAIYKAYSK